MRGQFDDVVEVLEAQRADQPTTIRIEEIAAGRLPKTMQPTDRKKEFETALNKWYSETAED